MYKVTDKRITLTINVKQEDIDALPFIRQDLALHGWGYGIPMGRRSVEFSIKVLVVTKEDE
jgi:hypothetical protein